MRYELTTLSCPILGVPAASAAARAWIDGARAGRLLGLWRSDIGTVAQLFVLRVFPDDAALMAERERALLSEDPFGSATASATLTMESYAPFLPPAAPRRYGGTFEFRTYHLVPGGLPGTIDGWRNAHGPAHRYTDHLVVALYALDGLPRITHLWGFASVEERGRLRAEHYAAGLWPPRGGPERIERAWSTIALAEPGLPIG